MREGDRPRRAKMTKKNISRVHSFPSVCYSCLAPYETFVEIKNRHASLERPANLDVIFSVEVPSCKKCAVRAFCRQLICIAGTGICWIIAILCYIAVRQSETMSHLAWGLIVIIIAAGGTGVTLWSVRNNSHAELEIDGSIKFKNKKYQKMYEEANSGMTPLMRLKQILDLG